MVDVVSKLPHIDTTIFTVITQRAIETGAVNLSQGFPDFDPPDRLKTLLAGQVAAGRNQYAPMTGVEALREQLALLFAHAHGKAPDPGTEITVTVGATEALFSSVQALVHAGDEAILFDPAYDAYGPAVELAGGRPVRVPLLPPDFAVDWQRVRDAVGPRTRLIIVNSPQNPTTAVLSPEDLDQLASLLRDTPVLVLSDEVYEHLVFDGRRPLSLFAHPELCERTVSVFSLGKTLNATGWRVGYAIAPAPLTREVRRVHQFNTFSIAAPMQYAIAEFLREQPGYNDALGAFYQGRRDRFLSRLAGSRFRFLPAAGTFFQLLEYSAISDLPDVEFADRVMEEAGVASIPLSPFYAEAPRLPYLRFCFAKTDDTLDRAAERLCQL